MSHKIQANQISYVNGLNRLINSLKIWNSFRKYLSNTFYILGSVLGAGEKGIGSVLSLKDVQCRECSLSLNEYFLD